MSEILANIRYKFNIFVINGAKGIIICSFLYMIEGLANAALTFLSCPSNMIIIVAAMLAITYTLQGSVNF
jgi:hypothetical protein